jgi:hypothetical protein
MRSSPSASLESRGLVAQIHDLRQQGFSFQEIARKTELSKRFVQHLAAGTRGISPSRAAVAASMLGRSQSSYIISDGQQLAVHPLNRREYSKVGRYWASLKQARRAGDYRPIRLRHRNTVIRTAEGDIRLETDPNVLRELDDAGLLSLDEPIHY